MPLPPNPTTPYHQYTTPSCHCTLRLLHRINPTGPQLSRFSRSTVHDFLRLQHSISFPPPLPVAELESYFRGRIRAANSIVNESRVVTGLRKTEVVKAQAMLLLGDGIPGEAGGRNRRVVVGEDRVCGVCHKRLGGSVIAVLPDNSVVHYGCLSRTRGSAQYSP